MNSITFPARPIQGGRLELAPPKRGLWYMEPKWNGWRTLVHTPTGTMWNRHGKRLTITDCFLPALAKLALLASAGLVWADCEALERRHKVGRGTLIVLDVVPESDAPIYMERRLLLHSLLPNSFGGELVGSVPSGAVLLNPAFNAESHNRALDYYHHLRLSNQYLGADVFEGLVMKRADSVYPVQLRSATEEFRGWVKHRFLT